MSEQNNPPTSPVLGNRYQLQQTLGKGGMSVVYRARDLMLERPVAVKVLRADYSRNPSFREHFRQEAKAVANLSHPNIVTVHDFGLDSSRLYIVMEYIPGTDLKSLIRRRSIFPVDEAVQLIIQAAEGIGYAHRAGLVHCDVKPHNMLVTPDRRLKVTDFGIARMLASIPPDEQNEVVWGSPQYFSPEQAGGSAPSFASDVYSLGVILYEMLAGRLPFDSDDASELAVLHRESDPIPPSRFNPAIPDPLEQIILKVLAKDPSARYRTADQLGRILDTFMRSMLGVSPLNAASRPLNSPSQPLSSTLVNRPSQPSMSAQVARNSQPVTTTVNRPSKPPSVPAENPFNIDWLTVFMGLIAVLAVGGLVPFWLFVWLSINSGRYFP
jgi:serine/threonine protein kinase